MTELNDMTHWNIKESKTLLYLYNNGFNFNEIAKLLQRSEIAIKAHYWKITGTEKRIIKTLPRISGDIYFNIKDLSKDLDNLRQQWILSINKIETIRGYLDTVLELTKNKNYPKSKEQYVEAGENKK